MDNRRNSGTFFNVFAIIVSLASFFIAWKIVLPQYIINKNHHSQVEAEVRAAKDKLESLKVAKTSLDNLGSIVDQIFIAIPDQKDDPNIISELEKIASKHNTYIPSIQIDDSTTGSSAVSVSFSVAGTFADTQAFIASIENNLKFFSIKSLAISSGSDGIISQSFQVEAYKQTDTSLTGTVASDLTSIGTEGGTE